MVRQDAVVTQRDVLLLPLLVEGFATSLQQDSLEETRRHSERRLRGGCSQPLWILNTIKAAHYCHYTLSFFIFPQREGWPRGAGGGCLPFQASCEENKH